MENKAHALAAGLFVLAMTALLAALAFWLTREEGVMRSYELVAKGAITGLQPQAVVQYKGVKIGKVDSIGFDPAQTGQVLVRMLLRDDAPITQATFATLSYQGVTGIAYVLLDDDPGPRVPLVAQASGVPRLPLRDGTLDQWSNKGAQLLERLQTVTERVDQLLSPANQQALRQSLDALRQAALAVPPAMGGVQQSFVSIQNSAASISTSAEKMGHTADSYDALALRLQQTGGPIDRLQQTLTTLGEAGQMAQQTSLPRLNRALEEAGRSASSLNRTASQLQEQPQALIFGNTATLPGPGESGFVRPSKAP